MDTQRSAHTEFSYRSLKSQNHFSSFFYRLIFLGYFTTMNRRLSDYALTVLRMYMGGNAVVAWYSAMSEPSSMIAKTTRTFDGTLLIWVLGIVGAAMVIDVIINDIMPRKYQWKKALKYRHYLFAALAASYVAQLFAADMASHSSGLGVSWAWHAGMTMIASFVDAKKRSRDAGCAMLYN